MDKRTHALRFKTTEEMAHPAVSPIYQASAFESQSAYFYTRNNNPNIQEFEQVVAALEEAAFGIATSTGMSAIHTCLSLLKPGQTLLINQHIYGCSFQLFHRFCEQFDIKLEILDLSDPSKLTRMPAQVDMVFFETPTNPFLHTLSIAKISHQVKLVNPDALVVVDNTWATPLFQQPLKWGADISLHSGTKYFSGHSDVMGGIILTNAEALESSIREQRFYGGAILPPFSAWLLRRSLQTLDIRLQVQGQSTRQIVAHLSKRKEIAKIYYPEIDGKQLTGYATLIFFEFAPEYAAAYPEFSQKLQLFSTGTGMACVTSMVAQPYTGSHASMSDVDKDEMGLSKSLVRLSFGLEKVEDLIQDLDQALDQL